MSETKSKRNCKNCGSEVSRTEKVYCNNTCQQEYQYKTYIDRWLRGLETGNNKSNTDVAGPVRKWIFNVKGAMCWTCGWNKLHPMTNRPPLEINHINGNSNDSSQYNIELLCPNCHSLTPTFRNLNKGNGRKNRNIVRH